jgi:hypothetical protein
MCQLIAIALVTAAGNLFAGGFWLQLGNPEANGEARRMHAALVVQATGCHNPAEARLEAQAIGMENGRRRTIPLKLAALSEPGTYALVRQWPAGQSWVIRLVATNGPAVTSALVAAGPDGVDRGGARFAAGPPAEGELQAMLRR